MIPRQPRGCYCRWEWISCLCRYVRCATADTCPQHGYGEAS